MTDIPDFHPALAQLSRSLYPHERSKLEARRLAWGCASVPLQSLAPYSIIVGTPGSGKTLLQKILLQSLLPDACYGLTYRAALFDPKRELYPFLVRAGIDEGLIMITHPYDTRSVAWHLPSDFTDEGHARSLASAFIPRRPETTDEKSKDFWTNAANQTLVHVITGLMELCVDGWTLRDIIEACSNPDTLRQVLCKTPSGRDSHEIYFNTREELAGDIRATLHSYIFPYQPIASLWHRADSLFSLTKWRSGTGVLLLGTDPERFETMQTLNNLLIQRMSQIIIAQLDELPPDLTWLFLDELREAGKFPGFRSMLTMGRSKGVRVVLGFQDTFGLNAAFGKDEACEILGICDNKAILHLGSPEATRWASELFGETEQEVAGRHISHDRKLSSTYNLQRVFEVLPIEFHELPLAQNMDGAINGFFHHPGGINYRGSLSAGEVDAALPPPSNDLPNPFVPRPPSDQKRIPWSDDDYDRLSLTPPPGSMAGRHVERPNHRSIRVMPWH